MTVKLNEPVSTQGAYRISVGENVTALDGLVFTESSAGQQAVSAVI